MIDFKIRGVLLFLVALLYMTNEAISKTDFDEPSMNALTCPTVASQFSSALDMCGAAITIANPTSTDATCVIQTVTNDFNNTSNASDFYPVGITTVTFTVNFTNGMSNSCSIDINVDDAQSPNLLCPPVPPVNCSIANLAVYTTLAEFLAAGGAVSDNCGIDESSFTCAGDVVMNPGGCPIMINRSYTIMDLEGQQGRCFQMVEVQDTEDPNIICPTDITISTADAGCMGSATLPSATAGDNCTTNPTITNDITGSDPFTNVMLPVGVHNVVWTAIDNCGNDTDCMMIITVVDDVLPIARCLAPTVDLGSDGTIDVDPSLVDNDSSDNCGVMSIDIVPSSFDCDDIGDNNVVLTVTDVNGNVATCEATVTVEDNTPPIINCPSDMTIECDDPLSTPLTFMQFLDMGLVSDNCALDPMSFTVNDVSDGMTCPETITRTYAVSDLSGNGPVSCEQEIKINDTTRPIVVAPADITVTCLTDVQLMDTDNTGGIPITFSDNCTAMSDMVPFFVDNDPGFPVDRCMNREIWRSWFVRDLCGNISLADIQNITINDAEAPDFTGVTQTTMIADISCEDFPDNLPAVPAYGDLFTGSPSENCPGGSTITTEMELPMNLSCATANNTITYWYIATDHCGNSSSIGATFQVMADQTNPVIDVSSILDIDDIGCADDFPTPQDITTIMATDNCTAVADITISFDMVIPASTDVCAGYEVQYRWRATDLCNNVSDYAIKRFMVLGDNTAPVVNCSVDLTINVQDGECFALYTPTPPPAIDDCSGLREFVLTPNASIPTPIQTNPDIYNLVPGDYLFIWQAIDECGNATLNDEFCNQTVTVRDNQNPQILSCGLSRVVLDYQGEMKVNAVDIIVATDNCPDALTYQLERMDVDARCDPDDLEPNECITFCCEDVTASPFMVRAIVTDAAGNSTVCMFEIDVVDFLPPTVTCPTVVIGAMALPSDITVDCEFPVGDYTIFGDVASDPMDQDPSHSIGLDFYGDEIWITDGLATDNCGIESVLVDVDDSDLVCNMGIVTRTFVVTDVNGNVNSSCVQTIEIRDNDPLVLGQIDFPDDVTVMDICGFNPNHPDLLKPTWPEGKCTMASAHPEDKIFDHPVSGCLLIQRTWTIIDWCQTDINGNPFEFVSPVPQFIHWKNSTKPVLECDQINFFTQGNSCEVLVEFEFEVEDDCTEYEDLVFEYDVFQYDGDYNFIAHGETPNVSINLPPTDEYIFRWTVSDQCGNTSTCEQIIGVIDNKAPVAYCISVLTTSISEMQGMPNPMVEIWAKDFAQKGEDNCDTEDELTYSFSPNGEDMSMVFDCDDLPSVDLTVYTTDRAGNQSSCMVTLIIDDPNSLCPDDFAGTEEDNSTAQISLAGEISNMSGVMIENAEVRLNSEDKPETMLMSNDEGAYAFSNLDTYKDYEVKPSKTGDFLEGLSTVDIVIIQKHILGLDPMESPYQIIAADVDNSQSVSAADIISLRKLILGLSDKLPNDQVWKFIDAHHKFNNVYKPWPYPSQMVMNNLDHDVMDLDFIAVKSGDVNNSLNLDEAKNLKQKIGLKVSEPKVIDKDTYMVAVQLDRSANISGLQMELLIKEKSSFIELQEGLLPIEARHYNILEGGDKLRISFDQEYTSYLDKDAILFYMVLDAKGISNQITLSPSAIKAEIYDDELNVFEIQLEQLNGYANNKWIEHKGTSIPNPFYNETRVELKGNSNEAYTLYVYNSVGELIYKNANQLANSGVNHIVISKESLNGKAGAYFYRIELTENLYSGKIILAQ